MTREAKIGMLTGLGVIVLIGVLLSEYLGDPNTPGPLAAVGAQLTPVRMASLPIGESYRKQIMEPVGIPAMATPANGAVAQPVAAADTSAVADASAMVPPMMVNASIETPAVSGPAIAAPVSPIVSDGVPVAKFTPAAPPMIELPGDATVDVKAVQTASTAVPAATKTVSYEIQPKDTLAKIAKKFYGEAKDSCIKKIVAANPGSLKDVNSVLIAGRKLSIPGVAVAPAKVADVKFTPIPKVTIAPPASAVTKGSDAPHGKIEQPKTDAKKEPKIYVVQSGDTLEKIAHKIAPSKSGEMVHKLMAVNGIKDADSLQAGAKLRLPA